MEPHATEAVEPVPLALGPPKPRCSLPAAVRARRICFYPCIVTLTGAIAGMTPMTRDDALALYRPIRAGIQRVLRVASTVCSRADMTRAAKQLGLWAESQIAVGD